MSRKMRIAAELVEQIELSKNKQKELANLVDNFIATITDLEDEYFTNPDKETLHTTIQKEQETCDEKYDEFMKTNDKVILEAESSLAGLKVVQQVNVPQETSANNWRTFKPQANLKPNYLEK